MLMVIEGQLGQNLWGDNQQNFEVFCAPFLSRYEWQAEKYLQSFTAKVVFDFSVIFQFQTTCGTCHKLKPACEDKTWLFARLRVVHRGTQSNITGTCEVSLHRSFPALLWIAPNILRYIGDPKKNVLQSGVTRSIALKTGHLVNFCTVLYLRICKRTYRIWRIASSAETSEQSQIQHHTSHSKIKMPQSGEPPFRHHPLCTQAEI